MNKDKVLQGVLDIAIGIMYPIVVFFAVNTFVGDKETGRSVPKYDDDYGYLSPVYDYDRGYLNDDTQLMLKISIALAIAILTFVALLYFYRSLKPVVRGLSGGAGLTAFIASIWSLSVNVTSTGASAQRAFIQIASFAALTTMLYWAERHVDRTGPAPVPQTPPVKTAD